MSTNSSVNVETSPLDEALFKAIYGEDKYETLYKEAVASMKRGRHPRVIRDELRQAVRARQSGTSQ